MEDIVTYQLKYNQWKVFHKGGDITIESTDRMTPQQALKHFKSAIGVIGILEVSDFGITTNGTLVTHIHNNGSRVEVWSGNPFNDKYAEELILSKSEKERIFEEI